MQKLKLSIIIPFYNVEKYIAECLDSVYAQDIPEDEYEIICINDCGLDNSREIVLDYQNKHSNLWLIEHDTNKMLGAGRNTGLRAAKGEYVWFIDSDDYIENNVIKKLLDIIVENNLEILKFNSCRFNNNHEISDFMFLNTNTSLITGIQYCEEYLLSCWNLLAWSKIFKRSFLIENELFFPEGVYFEDNFHSIKSYLLCKRFMYISDQIYFYRINMNSIMTSSNLWGSKKMADRLEYNINSIDFIDKYIDEGQKKFKLDLINCYVWALSKYRKVILKFSLKDLHEFYGYIGVLNEYLLAKYMNKNIYYFYTKPKLTAVVIMLLKPLIMTLALIKKVKDELQ